MTNGEVKESPLVSQASELVAKTILEIERLRAQSSASVVYPSGIGSISVRIKVGEEAVEVNVGSPEVPRALRVAQVAKHTMTYSISTTAIGTNSATTTQIEDAGGNLVTLIVDDKQHTVAIAL